MNNIDHIILGLLKDNARMSITDLAAKARVSRATVQKRIEYMESTGVITGYTIRFRPNAERNVIRAWMSIMVEGTKAQAVIRELRLESAVERLHTTNGKWDILVELESDSLINFDKALERIRNISGIYNSETSILLSTYKT
ncbi:MULTISPECIES: Lrp/AsnC family transcriptional regulator [Acinetobacter]|uniref:AsnC family transcriptional regulator n=4 Tax=Acinetobacter TaxID=469 RepID=A0A1L6KPG2_ACIHA|nr:MULTISPECIES: Lrp/AsnC family transcriptional regulator [Acinetobacter]APR70962.1 AsnC family transcriptional regulator [Acinetobacter haemolyticus]ATZ66765.1 AsnC family transcriptional regulator [Acinetobacter haemolyticus]AZN69618.1 Lrp/AsnC family transcriptional regulator [Acinetobacter haemolyticus]EEH69242.1 transcriptional regulator, AsnC family [Acinetobacter sp. ATCC 27244]EFF83203.1 transcriptional regulator, AsnC family [Acinetobacter haemolyticus ATCC 19194]